MLIALALLVAACGDSGGTVNTVASLNDVAAPGATATGTVIEVDTEEQLFKFAACIRDQGFDLPDPTVDREGNVNLEPPENLEDVDWDGLLDAANNCDEFLEGVSLGFTPQDLTNLQDGLLEFAQCMRDNGYDLPDPDFSFIFDDPEPGEAGPGAFGPFGELDPEDPEWQAAFAQCQEVLLRLAQGGFGEQEG